MFFILYKFVYVCKTLFCCSEKGIPWNVSVGAFQKQLKLGIGVILG